MILRAPTENKSVEFIVSANCFAVPSFEFRVVGGEVEY